MHIKPLTITIAVGLLAAYIAGRIHSHQVLQEYEEINKQLQTENNALKVKLLIAEIYPESLRM